MNHLPWIVIPIIVLIVGILIINFLINTFNITKKEQFQLKKLLWVSFIFIVIFATINYFVVNEKYKKDHDNENLSFADFINQGTLDNNFIHVTIFHIVCVIL